MKTLADNRKARFEYDLLETLEAGLALTGQEVKSARGGHIKISDAFVTFHDGEALLTNAHIARYRYAGELPDYNPTHSRRLLLHRKEIAYLQGKALEKGLTVVPLRVYTNGRLLKITLAVARGRRTYDKREVLKKRDIDREAKRATKEL